MTIRLPQRRMLIAYVSFYLVLASVAARAVFEIVKKSDVWWTLGFMGVYLLFLLVQPVLIRRSLVFMHIITAVQVGIALFLLLMIDQIDFFALLIVPPCALSILYFPRKVALTWIGVSCLLMIAILIEHFPLNESVGYVIIYPTAIFLFTGFSYLAQQSEQAQARSEALLADLQVANQKLQVYSAQVQELAAAAERNRLARELHDSVTQIIFGLTLSAQAARILIDRNPARAAAELDHIQMLAQNALAEMRSLIQQLHPHSPTEDGLAPALRRLAAERQASDGLEVALRITGERRLPEKVEADLFRIAHEALNNIIKHAQTNHAVITLNMENASRVWMSIEDAGIGFDPAKVRATQPGHLGLTSMKERIQALGGTLIVDSKPGNGTRVRVELALSQEVEHA